MQSGRDCLALASMRQSEIMRACGGGEVVPRLISLNEVAGLAGQELGVSAWHTVDQKQVNVFAEATGDYEWFHVDVERAKREMGGTIVHGFLTLSIVPALWSQLARITVSVRCVVEVEGEERPALVTD